MVIIQSTKTEDRQLIQTKATTSSTRAAPFTFVPRITLVHSRKLRLRRFGEGEADTQSNAQENAQHPQEENSSLPYISKHTRKHPRSFRSENRESSTVPRYRKQWRAHCQPAPSRLAPFRKRSKIVAALAGETLDWNGGDGRQELHRITVRPRDSISARLYMPGRTRAAEPSSYGVRFRQSAV